jgi:hypothetical protein
MITVVKLLYRLYRRHADQRIKQQYKPRPAKTVVVFNRGGCKVVRNKRAIIGTEWVISYNGYTFTQGEKPTLTEPSIKQAIQEYLTEAHTWDSHEYGINGMSDD